MAQPPTWECQELPQSLTPAHPADLSLQINATYSRKPFLTPKKALELPRHHNAPSLNNHPVSLSIGVGPELTHSFLSPHISIGLAQSHPSASVTLQSWNRKPQGVSGTEGLQCRKLVTRAIGNPSRRVWQGKRVTHSHDC